VEHRNSASLLNPQFQLSLQALTALQITKLREFRECMTRNHNFLDLETTKKRVLS